MQLQNGPESARAYPLTGLRHSMATHSLERGANIALVAATLGHSDVQITSKYLHARPSDSASLYLVID